MGTFFSVGHTSVLKRNTIHEDMKAAVGSFNFDAWKDLQTKKVYPAGSDITNKLWIPPKEMPGITVTVIGYNKLEGGPGREGVIAAISPDAFILRFKHRDTYNPVQVYFEPYDTIYGERETDDGEWGMCILETDKNHQLELLHRFGRHFGIKFPNRDGVYS